MKFHFKFRIARHYFITGIHPPSKFIFKKEKKFFWQHVDRHLEIKISTNLKFRFFLDGGNENVKTFKYFYWKSGLYSTELK